MPQSRSRAGDLSDARGRRRGEVQGTLDDRLTRHRSILAIALGIQACRHGHRVLSATATDWVTRLFDAHRAGRLATELAKLRRYGLIIIDEVGYLPFGQAPRTSSSSWCRVATSPPTGYATEGSTPCPASVRPPTSNPVSRLPAHRHFSSVGTDQTSSAVDKHSVYNSSAVSA